MQVVLSILLIVGVPVILIYMVATLEPFRVSRRGVALLSFGWGIASFLTAYAIQRREQLDLLIDPLAITVFYAPLLEEFLKMLFLMVIYNRTLARYAGDGAVYGFTVGSGFALAENFSYMLNNPDQALGITVARVVSTGLFHASIAGIVGASVSSVIFYRRRRAYPVFLLLYLFAVIAHYWFNVYAVLALFTHSAGISVALGIATLVITLALQRFSGFRERRRIIRDAQDDLTSMQIAIIKRGDAVLYALDNDRPQLDDAQEPLIEDYLALEAQAALLTRRVINERGKRQVIHQLRQELSDLQTRIRNLKQQMSPEAVAWLNKQKKSQGH